ncbi:MAG: phytanoyl-CoA dioxygenase family protein [Rhodopila sp.]
MLMRLDPASVGRFHDDGFLAFDTGLPEAEIATLHRTLTGLINRDAGFKEGAMFDAMGIDDGRMPRRFTQILHPRVFAPELLESEFHRLAHSIAEQLLGQEMRFKADICLMKPARIGETTPWHQDEAFQDPAFTYNEVSFWLALQPTDETNSCMAYIPGSHRSEVLPHRFPGGDARVHALECQDGFDPADAVPCPLPAGGCVIHTQRALHGAGPNRSDRDRLAYVLVFDRLPVPATEPRSFPWRAQQRTARAQRELVWRRQGGLLVHLWRQRSRIRLNLRTLWYDMRRAARALRRAYVTGG